VDSGEDRGSTPLASSLRFEARKAKAVTPEQRVGGLYFSKISPCLKDYGLAGQPNRGASSMSSIPTKFFYVYVLASEIDPKRRYTGLTCHLQERLQKHNRGKCLHTSKHKPWKIETVAFRSEAKARCFERYLKTGSGREFARRHF
jgi:putative endonuclease